MIVDEKVFVINRSLFEQLGSFQGLHVGGKEYLASFLDPANHFFLERSKAEENPSFKQIIPYIVISCGDCFLYYQRGSTSGEKRLLKKLSIGIGGHINEEDASGRLFNAAAYRRALLRELEEEILLPEGFELDALEPMAFINDDSNPVGAVHLGVVHHCLLPVDSVKAKEAAIAQLGFFTYPELLERNGEFETWSQLLIQGWKKLPLS